MVKPNGNTLIDIEININGWKWICRVETWTETISFGQKTWTITGRSPSIELGTPYQTDTVFNNVAHHGGQIIDDILNGTEWTANWKSTDFDPYTNWMISANTLSLYEASKIEQMKTIVQAVNAFIQTKADQTGGKQFIIRPKYKKNPWKWSTDIEPEVMLNDSVCCEIGQSNKILKPIDSVILSGDNNGVIVQAVKDGTAGSNPAPMQINSLITSQEAGRELARHIIGDSGFWIDHQMKLFSLMSPGDAPGLLLPGDFIQMQEGGATPWIGQVTSTCITAQWSNGLIVNQSLGVEQFYG